MVSRPNDDCVDYNTLDWWWAVSSFTVAAVWVALVQMGRSGWVVVTGARAERGGGPARKGPTMLADGRVVAAQGGSEGPRLNPKP